MQLVSLNSIMPILHLKPHTNTTTVVPNSGCCSKLSLIYGKYLSLTIAKIWKQLHFQYCVNRASSLWRTFRRCAVLRWFYFLRFLLYDNCLRFRLILIGYAVVLIFLLTFDALSRTGNPYYDIWNWRQKIDWIPFSSKKGVFVILQFFFAHN